MRIRLARDEDYAAIARLHRQTIRNVNSKDYTEDQINTWSARTNAFTNKIFMDIQPPEFTI